ncbi:hypothetical protein ACWD3J_00425 [Streptomyces sp. NPDC002755]|uniref:hypothetical protein n=1 Tax=Streptomyces sp. NPDC002884 TaxID=3154544 RepID=UPI00331AE79F
MSGRRITDWHLGHLVLDPATGKGTTWDMGKPVSPDVVEKYQECVNFLEDLLSESPYSGLEKRYVELKSAISAMWGPDYEVGSAPSHRSEILSRLDNMLSALRAFDDRTSRDLKHRCGDGSTPFRTFKEALSYEYDNEFAYRFMYRLRNYSQHCGQPELTGSVKGRRTADGKIVRQVSMTFDLPALLRRFNKWGPQVKGELEGMGEGLEVEPVVDRLFLSCGRAYGKLLVSLATDIRSAVDFIRSCDKSPDGSGTVPCFYGLNRDEWLSAGSRDTNVRLVRVDLADLADNVLVAAAGTAS